MKKIQNPIIVSVIIATCNRPELAFRAVKSVLSQSFEEKEIILINNGTSKENIKLYNVLFSKLFDSIKYVDLSESTSIPLGPSIARNFGISLASGEYVTFCDDDDEWIDNNYLKSIYNILMNEQPDIIFSDQKSISSDGVVKSESWFKHSELIKSGIKLKEQLFYIIESDYFYKNGGFPHLNITLYSRELIEQYGAFSKELSYEEDFELFHRLLSYANRVLYYDKIVSHHYIPDKRKRNNVTTKMSDDYKILSRIYIFNKLIIENNNKKLLNFSLKNGSYSVCKMAEKALERKDFFLASKMALQALGWRFSFKMIYVFIYSKFNDLKIIKR